LCNLPTTIANFGRMPVPIFGACDGWSREDGSATRSMGWVACCHRLALMSEAPGDTDARRVDAFSSERRLAIEAIAVVFVMLALAIGWFSFHRRPAENTLAVFQNQMAGFALRGYAMDLLTEDDGKIRAYLKERQSPADYVVPASLQQVARSGCAVEGWLDSKVSLICFRTGKPLAASAQSDLWLFVADEKLVKNAPTETVPQIAKVNRLITATWASGGKIYFLSTEGEAADIKKYL